MNRIRQLRQQMGWKQEDLAIRLNTKRQTVGHYETGERGIDMETICRLCDIFNCTADYLIGRTPTGGIKLSPEEETIIIALRRADNRAIEMVNVALSPFKQDESSGMDATTA